MSKISTGILVGGLFLLGTTVSRAATEDVPSILHDGFSAFGGGVMTAVETWVKDGPLEGNAYLYEGAVKKLEDAAALFGVYQSYELIRVREWNSFSKTVFVALRYKKGVIFGKFLLYQPKGEDWIVTDLDFDSNPSKILYAKRSPVRSTQ